MPECRNCARIEEERDALRAELAAIRARPSSWEELGQAAKPGYASFLEARKAEEDVQIDRYRKAGRDMMAAARSLKRITHRIESRAKQLGAS